MEEPIRATLNGWADFYLITGSSAAALTGLQFVVQTLLASGTARPATNGDPEGSIGAFGTPTVVHFSHALLVSAMLCVPWPGYGGLRVCLGVLGTCALVYSAIVLRRARRQRVYVPVAEDWLWHVVLPAVAYAAVLLTAVLLGGGGEEPLFVVAAATLLLLCAGIHNAWDTVTYLTVNALRPDRPQGDPAPPRRNEPGKRRRNRR